MAYRCGEGGWSGHVTTGSLAMAAIVRPAFYRQMAIALSLFVIIGFSRTYYLRFLTDLPPLQTLVHWHSLIFTAWLLVFIVQTRLVAAQRVDLHMKLGIASLVLAAAVVGVSFATTAYKATIPLVHPSGLTPPQFSIVGIMSLALFTGFLTLGVIYRRRSAYHKRFMILAMIGVLTPAASRIVTQLGLREHWTYLVPIMPALFVAFCLAYDWRKQRLVHPVYAIGGAVLIASWPLRIVIGRAEWYQPVGEWVARIGVGLQ
jgi:hypothetical protein